MLSSRRRILAALLLTVCVSVPPALAAEADPGVLVRQSIDSVMAKLRTDSSLADPNKLQNYVEGNITPYFDFARMTSLAMGKHWNRSSATQKTALTREFRRLLIRTYAQSMYEFRSATMVVLPVKSNTGTEATVDVETQSGSQAGRNTINFTMQRSSSSADWKAIDVKVNDVSLVTNYRNSFAQEINKSGIDGLIKTLARQNNT